MKIATAIKIYTGSTSQKPIIEDRVKVVASPTRNNVEEVSLKELLFYLAYFLQFFSSQLATPRNLKSSSLSPINCKPNGKLFAPVSKGNEIVGSPM